MGSAYSSHGKPTAPSKIGKHLKEYPLPRARTSCQERPTKVIACVGLGLCLARYHLCPEGSAVTLRRRGKVRTCPIALGIIFNFSHGWT